MKYLKIYEDFENSNNLETLAKELLINKEIVATNDKLIDSLPFRISSNELKFKPVDCKVTIVDGEKALKVYVPIENIEGECTNPYKGTYTDSIAACMVMTAWIHWHITSKNLPEHVNVMVYNKPV
jgi:hypothetical protein